MNQLSKRLAYIARLLHTDIFVESWTPANAIQHLNDSYKNHPLFDEPFRQKIQAQRMQQMETGASFWPFIFQDEFGVCYLYFQAEQVVYYVGPLSLVQFHQDRLHTYCQFYRIKEASFEMRPFLLDEILDVSLLLMSELFEYEGTHEDILSCNQQFTFSTKLQQQEPGHVQIPYTQIQQAHHTYQEERQLLDYVKRGEVQKALTYQNAMDHSIGKLAQKEVNHWKNLAIVAITLTTRAAIDGGVLPAIAYQISDAYIQKCDEASSVSQMVSIRNAAVEKLAQTVHKTTTIQSHSSYIKMALHYIDKHYREKIYLEKIAQEVGLSVAYFSRQFKKEVGMSFQIYVIRVRLEYAANLLRYSKESIATIAEYVHFPSQSYFGRYFKQFYHMTPAEFRRLYQVMN